MDPELVARIRALPPTEYAGRAYRHLSPGLPPLSGHGAWVNGGRWNPPNRFPVLYLALSTETAKAEFFRMAKKMGERPETFLPRELHEYAVDLGNLLDLRDRDVRRHLGLSDRQLYGDPPDRCQAIGEAAHEAGREGLIAPSATRVGFAVPVFFGRLQPDSSVVDDGFERWRAVP